MGENYRSILDSARKEVSLADHMLYMTMPLVRDTNLFLSVVEHLHSALINILSSFLVYEYSFKRINILPSQESLVLKIFFENYSSNLSLTDNDKSLIFKLCQFVEAARRSDYKINKGDKLVVLSSSYEMASMDKALVKEYIKIAKNLLSKVELRVK